MRSLFFLLSLATCGSAYADDRQALPDLHLREKCGAQAKAISGSASNAISDDCVKSEQEAFDSLKKYWPKFDEARKEQCIATSSRQKLGNYKILAQCLNREMLRVDGQLKDNPTGKGVGSP